MRDSGQESATGIQTLLDNRPGVRLKNQLIFQLQTKLFVSLMEPGHSVTRGARISPALPEALTQETLHDSQTTINQALISILRNECDARPAEEQGIDQGTTLDAAAKNPAFQDQAQFTGCIRGHGLMKIPYRAHTLEIWQTGQSFIDWSSMEPVGAGRIQTKPDIMHGLDRSIGCEKSADLEMLVPCAVYRVRREIRHTKMKHTSLLHREQFI